MSSLIEVNDTNFEAEVLKSAVPAVVDFAASWCGPCRRLAPVIEELAAAYAGRVKVCHLDVDEASDTAGRFGIMSVPSVLFFKNGQKVDMSLGLVSREALVEKINALL